MAKASEQRMGELHGLTTELLIMQLNQMLSGEIDTDPRIIADAIKLLKDNNIQCTAEEMLSQFKLNGITLPKFEEIAEGAC